MPRPLAGDKSFMIAGFPVALTVCHELAGEGFGIIDIQQLAQQPAPLPLISQPAQVRAHSLIDFPAFF